MLLKRLDAITNKLADCLNDHLKDLEKIDIKTIDDVDKIESGKINSVVNLFDFLVKYARNFDKISFGQRVEAAVNKYNMQQQNTYKLTKEEGPVKQFGFWAKMRQLKPFVTARKNHRLNIYKEALVKSSNKQEKQAAIEGIKQISKMESYNLRISYDDGIIEDEFILGIISNSNTVAGIKNLFKNDIQDGLFEVVLIKKPSNIANLSTIITALAEKKLDNPMMYHFKSRNFVFESLDNNGIKWTLDGEFGGVFTSAEIDVCPLEVTLNI